MPPPASDIDPYHLWLGIPKDQQPPTHYRLLGIEPFETDPEVIEMASNRQVAYLHQLVSGPNRRLTQKLLNEIAKARRTLLDDAMRSKYEDQLRSKLADSQPSPIEASQADKTSTPSTPGIEKDLASPASMGNLVIDTGATSKTKSVPKASPTPAPKTDAPAGTADQTKPSESKAKSVNPGPDFASLKRRSSKPKKAPVPAAESSSPSFSFAPSKEPTKTSAKRSKLKSTQSAIDPNATRSDVGDDGAKTQERSSKKPRLHPNDWRIHVGVSLISIALLVGYLALRGGAGSDTTPAISAEEDPSSKGNQRRQIDSLDGAFSE